MLSGESQGVRIRDFGDRPNSSKSIACKLDHIATVERDDVDEAAKVGV